MKITIIDQSLNGGGAEKVLCNLIRHLNEKLNYEVNLIITDKLGDLKYLVPEDVTVYELGVKHTRYSFFRVLKALGRIRPDFVFTTLSRTNILSIIGSFFIKYRSIVYYPSTPVLEKQAKILKGWRYLLYKIFYRKAYTVIAQTEEIAAQLQQFYKIDKDKIKVIINPVDNESINRNIENSENPFRNDKINVVASGRISIEKGFDILVESFSKVVEKNDKFQLHILGKDSNNNMEKLKKRISELGVNKSITFHGFQKNPYPYYNFCDLFVLSSRWEGLPNVVLECQYLGRPIVATRCIPVIERLIDHGKNGFVVDVGDVEGLGQAILNYKALKGEKIFRDSMGEFIEIFNE